MQSRRAREFVAMFFGLDPEDRVEIVRKFDLVETDYVPSRADERRQWFRTAINRAQTRGKIGDVVQETKERYREKHEKESGVEVGILVSKDVDDDLEDLR